MFYGCSGSKPVMKIAGPAQAYSVNLASHAAVPYFIPRFLTGRLPLLQGRRLEGIPLLRGRRLEGLFLLRDRRPEGLFLLRGRLESLTQETRSGPGGLLSLRKNRQDPQCLARRQDTEAGLLNVHGLFNQSKNSIAFCNFMWYH